MLIQKLQLSKIPDSLEAALEYKGAKRWVCWYWDDEETLLIEDINSSYFGNSQAWLLFCSYVDNNPHVEFKGSAYEHFESLISSYYPYDEKHEAETQVIGNLSLSLDKTAYLFDRQARELYSGSAEDIQTLIKQPSSLAMWAELQGTTCNNTKFEKELSLSEPTIDEWILTKSLVKLVAVWFAFAMILPVPWASAMHLLKSVRSHFSVNQSTDSIEKLKADLALKNLRRFKEKKSDCKIQTSDK